MAVKAKKKLTYAQMMGIMNQMAQTLTQVESMVNHYGKVLDDYIMYREDKDKFIEYLEKKYPKKGEKDAATQDKEGQSQQEDSKKEDNKEEKEILNDRDNENTEDK